MKACIQRGKGRHRASHHQNGRCVSPSTSPPHPLPPHTAVMWLVPVLMLLNEPSAGGWRLRLGSIRYYTPEIISVWHLFPPQQLLCFGDYWGFLDKGSACIRGGKLLLIGPDFSLDRQAAPHIKLVTERPLASVYVTDTKSQESLIPCQITFSEVEDFFSIRWRSCEDYFSW